MGETLRKGIGNGSVGDDWRVSNEDLGWGGGFDGEFENPNWDSDQAEVSIESAEQMLKDPDVDFAAKMAAQQAREYAQWQLEEANAKKAA
jgi:hypothetical protein